MGALQVLFFVVIHFPHGAEEGRSFGIFIADTVVVIVFRPFLFVAVVTHVVGVHEVNGGAVHVRCVVQQDIVHTVGQNERAVDIAGAVVGSPKRGTVQNIVGSAVGRQTACTAGCKGTERSGYGQRALTGEGLGRIHGVARECLKALFQDKAEVVSAA